MAQQINFPIFSLPYLAIEDILKEMDYETKFRLSQCSNRSKIIVQTKRVSYLAVMLSVNSGSMIFMTREIGEHSINRCTAGIMVSDRICSIDKLICNKVVEKKEFPTSCTSRMLKELGMLFSSPNTIIEHFVVRSSKDLVSFERQRFLREFRKMLRNLGHELKVKKFEIFTSDETMLLNFLSALNTEYLESIKITAPRAMLLKKTVKSDQWKKAQKIIANGAIKLSMDEILQIPKVVTKCSLSLEQMNVLFRRIRESGTFQFLQLFQYIHGEQGLEAAGLQFQFEPSSKMYTYKEDGFTITVEIREVNDKPPTLFIKKQQHS